MATPSTPILLIDAFASPPYIGNPASVLLLASPASNAWMQRVAQETSSPATAFVQSAEEEGRFNLRWFSPTEELALCGHGTLSAAHTLWATGAMSPMAEIRFETRGGTLTAHRDGEWICLDFPAKPVAPTEAPPELLTALGATPRFVGRSQLDYLIELENEEIVRALPSTVAQSVPTEARGFIVTARAAHGSEFDFVSRFFAPKGIPEDPATGSAHCVLGPYWAERLGKSDLIGLQTSARGGVIRVRPEGDRVMLAGKAITVLRGELDLPYTL